MADVILTPEMDIKIRSYLWLSHGHTGQYGDDGEMQCCACIPYGGVDFKRASYEDIFKWLAAIGLEKLATLRI